MRIWLSLLLLAAFACAPAAAAERVLLMPATTTARLAATAKADALRAEALAQGSVRVIVGLRVPFAPEADLPAAEGLEQRREIATASAALKARLATAVARDPGAVRRYESIPFVALDVTPAEFDRLRADPGVISIEKDVRFRIGKTESFHASDVASNNLVRAPQAWDAGFTGYGQTIAIIDTGVDKTHPFLAGKVVSEACYSNGYCPGGVSASTAAGSGMPCGGEGCDHGTHVAGIAAGRGTVYSGVARDAKIIAIQVFSAPTTTGGEVEARVSDILSGLERVFLLRNSFRIAAVNMSVGGGSYTSYCDADFAAGAAIVNNLRSAGIATVAASGNESTTNAMGAPACFKNAVSVGAVSSIPFKIDCDAAATVDKVACFSNTASFLSLLAPGAPISSSVPGGGYAIMMGTSQATPHVAGAFAVLRQNTPKASVGDILTRLQKTGRKVVDYRVPTIVKPRIDVAAALVLAPTSLNYARSGSGSGVVTIATAKGSTNCSTNCRVSASAQTVVTAKARPSSNARFLGWGGPCKGTGTCRFILAPSTRLTAYFVKVVALSYEKLGTGQGRVTFRTAGGINSCTASCTRRYPPGTVVTLATTPASNSVFAGWGGACKGKATCTVTMSAAASVTATFKAK